MNEVTRKLDWIGALGKKNPKANNDISIRHTISENGESHYTGITLRHECWKLITDTPYVEVAIFKNRVFFKESDAIRGLTLCSNKNTSETTRYIRFYNGHAPKFIAFEGDYELKYDEFYELYYIERKEEE